MQHYGRALVELVETVGQRRERNVVSGWQMALAPLIGISDIDYLDPVLPVTVQRHRVDLADQFQLTVSGFPFVHNRAMKNTPHARQANLAKLAEDLRHRLFAIQIADYV